MYIFPLPSLVLVPVLNKSGCSFTFLKARFTHPFCFNATTKILGYCLAVLNISPKATVLFFLAIYSSFYTIRKWQSLRSLPSLNRLVCFFFELYQGLMYLPLVDSFSICLWMPGKNSFPIRLTYRNVSGCCFGSSISGKVVLCSLAEKYDSLFHLPLIEPRTSRFRCSQSPYHWHYTETVPIAIYFLYRGRTCRMLATLWHF